ncbi:hypothetical protein ACJX0J_026162, partial [Zea mays]
FFLVFLSIIIVFFQLVVLLAYHANILKAFYYYTLLNIQQRIYERFGIRPKNLGSIARAVAATALPAAAQEKYVIILPLMFLYLYIRAFEKPLTISDYFPKISSSSSSTLTRIIVLSRVPSLRK